ncbi:hypothetical protein [Ruminococcus sp.]|uniref:hypothetical protein n=1 Tax=Ruminococcus sp. TaxID=41978 RepID=UPI0025E48E9A|nr:hypothetical protein [Ruminococcus sp.]
MEWLALTTYLSKTTTYHDNNATYRNSIDFTDYTRYNNAKGINQTDFLYRSTKL